MKKLLFLIPFGFFTCKDNGKSSEVQTSVNKINTTKTSQQVHSNQQLILNAEFADNPFLFGETSAALQKELKLDFIIEEDAVENLHDPSITDIERVLKYESTFFEFYENQGREFLSNATISSDKFKLQNAIAIGMSKEAFKEALKIKDSISDNVKVHNVEQTSELWFSFNENQLIEITYDRYLD